MFAGTEATVLEKDINYYELGPWWSLLIHDADYTDFTSAKLPTDGVEWWPRLTTSELDELTDARHSADNSRRKR